MQPAVVQNAAALDGTAAASVLVYPVTSLLPQTEALRALLQHKRELELQQQQEEGERLQDQRLQSLALQQHDELLRRSQLQRRMLQQQQQQLLREEEGRSLQDPNFSSLLRLSRSPRNNSNGSSSNDEERPYVPRFLSLGSLGLNPVQIRLLLREGLAANPDIEELDLSRVGLTDDEGPMVCKSVATMECLKLFSLEGNPIGRLTAVELRKCLEVLQIAGDAVDGICADAAEIDAAAGAAVEAAANGGAAEPAPAGINAAGFAAAAVTMPTLESLDLGGCYLGGPRGFAEICRALCSNKTLKFLSLRGMQIDPAGGELLLECLRNNSTLQCLDVSDNNITAVAATAAAAAAAEQHLRLNSLVSANKSSLKRRAEREAVERRQMEKEEKDTKSFLMQLEAFRSGVNYSLL
ncbi:hypothetical protein, conserved [Eimeria maxima]|uniref:Leucine rich repeat protein n=1 Tax=Eimeria maxima TaxID=5804 RepID=U6MCE5_EIMMA|nr:hypothetical protein, conserved [Eimeria maxima]CDJ60114.1 hypothetical protein, conserved [Eimeria maxima]